MIDETIVQQTMRILKAYPSKGLSETVGDLNHYFSKKEVEARVNTLVKSMLEGDPILRRFLPFLLIHGQVHNDGLKIVLNSNKEDQIRIFKEFALEFGISAHLKAHGSSDIQVFRDFPCSETHALQSIWERHEEPSCGWEDICYYLQTYCLLPDLNGYELNRNKTRFNAKLFSEFQDHWIRKGGKMPLELQKDKIKFVISK